MIERTWTSLGHQTASAADEALHAGHTTRVPRPALVPGTEIHQVQPQSVGAMLRDQLVRSDGGAPALAHLGSLFGQDHALVAQAQERLAVLDQPQIADDLGEE